MHEIELKFQVPLHQQANIQKAFNKKTATQIQLNAKYYDSADLKLAQHKIALRQRLEGQSWVQTLKAPTADTFNRFEHEIDLGQDEPNSISLLSYQQHPQAKRLFKTAKIALDTPLELQFETQIQRTLLTKTVQNSQIEIALDVGKITHHEHEVAVFEIEFELKQGDISELIAFIQPWIKKYQLFLDTQSKSARGQLIKTPEAYPKVSYAQDLTLNLNDSPPAALQKMMHNSLMHLLPNSSAIANGHYQTDHVHQARVALRRLRSLLKIFAQWSTDIPPQWEDQLAEIFRQLGATRDRDALSASIVPQLIQAGSPVTELPPPSEPIIPAELLFQQKTTSILLLELLAFVYRTPTPSANKNLKKSVIKRLDQLQHQVCHQADIFLDLEDEDKHRVRKRLKRLRYAIEFVSGLFDATSVQQYLKVLKPAQESLGQFNDLVVAEQMFRAHLKQQPEIWFVLGWIAAEKHRVLLEAQRHLHTLNQTAVFWKDKGK